ncbi:MAG TPA: NADH-quinone oxidoreductase subunit A [Anaerolineaceae bacterium]|nr:NADH-quinone oxidoreductase subunit A [Anaerolineaceae bacterium]
MLSNWLYIGIFMLVALFLPTIAITLAGLLSPKRPNAIKNSTYECGIETVGPAWAQFRIQYYIFALVFLIFDVEVVFLYPWAVAYNRLGLFAIVEAIIFLLILFGGLLYAWRKGALRWS